MTSGRTTIRLGCHRRMTPLRAGMERRALTATCMVAGWGGMPPTRAAPRAGPLRPRRWAEPDADGGGRAGLPLPQAPDGGPTFVIVRTPNGLPQRHGPATAVRMMGPGRFQVRAARPGAYVLYTCF